MYSSRTIVPCSPLAGLLVACFLLPTAAVAEPPTTPSERLDGGSVILEVCVSRTAHLFHVVDQISRWSPYCHRQYVNAFEELTPADEAMLEKHRRVRSRRGWGGGLEQTFYSPRDLDAALEVGVAQGWIDAADARVEREVFTHFAPAVDRLLEAEKKHLERFRERLRKELPHLRALSGKFSRFFHDVEPTVPVYLLANPDDQNFGGGYNGGRLTVEIPRKRDAYPTFLHEVLHAFVNTREAELTRAVRDIEGLDYQTLNEGIAHALSPGILHADPTEHDPLVRRVARALADGKTLDDPRTRFHRYALALRPLLRTALDDETETIDTFVPRCLDAWRVLREMDAALCR